MCFFFLDLTGENRIVVLEVLEAWDMCIVNDIGTIKIGELYGVVR
ncbi:hypothetical protein GGGNBK_06430 [Sporosarcina sp. ANT_H38]